MERPVSEVVICICHVALPVSCPLVFSYYYEAREPAAQCEDTCQFQKLILFSLSVKGQRLEILYFSFVRISMNLFPQFIPDPNMEAEYTLGLLSWRQGQDCFSTAVLDVSFPGLGEPLQLK